MALLPLLLLCLTLVDKLNIPTRIIPACAIKTGAANTLMGESEPEQSPTSTIPMAETEAATVPRDYERLWADMTAYNERIYAQHQSGLSCEYDYQQPSFVLKNYGLTSEIFGVISVPAMEPEMPIYLGATSQHMAAGSC